MWKKIDLIILKFNTRVYCYVHFYVQNLSNILLNCSLYTFPKQSPSFFSSGIDYRDSRFCIRINSASACVLNAFKGTFRHVATGTIMFHNEANVRYPTNNWFVVLGESRRAWSAPSKGSATFFQRNEAVNSKD